MKGCSLRKVENHCAKGVPFHCPQLSGLTLSQLLMYLFPFIFPGFTQSHVAFPLIFSHPFGLTLSQNLEGIGCKTLGELAALALPFTSFCRPVEHCR